MKKIAHSTVFAILGAFSLIALTLVPAKAVVYQLADEAVSYDKTFALDVAGNSISYATAQAAYDNGTPASKTFMDGNISTGAITVISVAGMTAAKATNSITVAANTGLSRAAISLPGFVFIEGRDWKVGATSSNTAANIAAAISAKVDYLTITRADNIISATAAVNGTYYNTIAMASNNANITVGSALFTGGQDNATVSINNVAFKIGTNWTPGANPGTAATALANAINAHAGLSALITATANSADVELVSDAVGADKNFTLASSAPSAVSVTGARMTGGSNSAYTHDSAVITIPAHGFNRGLAVKYIEGTASIAPLVTETTYYVTPLTADTITLATTSVDAIAGHALVLTGTPGSLNTYELAPLAVSGNSSFKWEVSNDNSSWSDLAGASSVTISNYGTLPLTTSWDFGNLAYKYLRLNVKAPATSGALSLDVVVNGLPLSEFVRTAGDTMTGQLNMLNKPIVLTGQDGYVTASSTVTAYRFNGSGAGLTAGSVPPAAIGTGALAVTSVAAASVNVTGSGQLLTGNASSTALQALAPGQGKGALITNSTTGDLCISTGTAAGSWVQVKSITTACW